MNAFFFISGIISPDLLENLRFTVPCDSKKTNQSEKRPFSATVFIRKIRFLKENDADSKKVFIFEALINMDAVFNCIKHAY